MPRGPNTRTPAERLLEDVLSRYNYTGETHDKVQNFLELNALMRMEQAQQEIAKLQDENKKLKSRIDQSRCRNKKTEENTHV